MQAFAFMSGTGTACSVHKNSVCDNENTKWVASFQSESVKGCCASVYVDWINIFCCPLTRRRRVTLTISKQRAKIPGAFQTGAKDNLSTVTVGNLPRCVCFFPPLPALVLLAGWGSPHYTPALIISPGSHQLQSPEHKSLVSSLFFATLSRNSRPVTVVPYNREFFCL